MELFNVAKIIYTKGTASINIPVTVKTRDRVLWKGRACDLQEFTKYNKNWLVLEILRDKSVDCRDGSRPYIIIVE